MKLRFIKLLLQKGRIMNYLKPAIVTGVCGLSLSLLLSLMSRARLPELLIRPLIFGGIFFGLGAGALYLYRRFLLTVSEENGIPGQKVDIAVDDDDAKMVIGEADTGMDFAGFAEVDMPSGNDNSSEQEIGNTGSGFRQNAQGVEQNSTLGYTENGFDSSGSFTPMNFDDLGESVEEERPHSAILPSAEGRKVYARVPEMEKVVNADPKKLASTVQDLLSDG
jgi:hypothetical protein